MRFSAVCLASAMLAGSAIAADSSDTAPELAAILERMASTPGVESVFEESKELALLATPLESRGRIYFVPPDRFARFTLSPGFTALSVSGDEVRLREGRDGENVDLSGNRIARVFVENFTALWSGDRERLLRLYRAEFEGDVESWELRLVPRRSPLADVISRISLRGDGAGMTSMQVDESDGDSTLTRFVATDAERRFSPEELARIFEEGLPLESIPGER